jgi:hypothetical protein
MLLGTNSAEAKNFSIFREPMGCWWAKMMENIFKIALLCIMGQFSWCKYSCHDHFQASTVSTGSQNSCIFDNQLS